MEKKLETFGIQMTKHVLCSDDTKMITDAIADMKEAGVDLIICTGGMSVDPDDKTPGAIKGFRSGNRHIWGTDTAWCDVVSGLL